MVGGGAAAAAQDLDTQVGNGSHVDGKLRRAHVKDGVAVAGVGQTGVGVDHQGHRGVLQQLLHNGHHLGGAQTAVDAQGAHTQALQQGHSGGGGAAGEQLAVFPVHGGHHHRQVAVLLGGQHGGLGLVGVAHGLNQDQVGPHRRPDAHHLGVQGHCVLKIQVPHGL